MLELGYMETKVFLLSKILEQNAVCVLGFIVKYLK